MAYLIATADGNFTTAATWAACDANSVNDSEVTTTAIGTGNMDSSTFIPANVALDGVAFRVASRASGSPTNTLTVTLRNSTAGTNAQSVTVNVSDLAACDTTEKNGGGYFVKFGSTHTPKATDSYLIRMSMSATSTAVSMYVSSGTNLARACRTTTTGAPAAGDRMMIMKEMTGAGAANTRAVTMNNTASTLFGSSSGLSTSTGNMTGAALTVGNGGTLTWGTSASTNYL